MQEMQETWVWFLGWEDPLEEEKATHSRILAWKIPWTEEFGRLQSKGSQRVRHVFATDHTWMHSHFYQKKLFFYFYFILFLFYFIFILFYFYFNLCIGLFRGSSILLYIYLPFVLWFSLFYRFSFLFKEYRLSSSIFFMECAFKYV